jgi:hypothetical protein
VGRAYFSKNRCFLVRRRDISPWLITIFGENVDLPQSDFQYQISKFFFFHLCTSHLLPKSKEFPKVEALIAVRKLPVLLIFKDTVFKMKQYKSILNSAILKWKELEWSLISLHYAQKQNWLLL